MQINFVYDASVSSAPAGFKPALAYAAQQIDNLITNNITITIQVGWGEYNGMPLTGTQSEGGFSSSVQVNYAQLKTDMLATLSSATEGTALADLPAAAPSGTSAMTLANAQAKVFGLLSPTSSETDGIVGFGTGSTWNFSTTNRAIGGQSDFVGIAMHELTHAMGRTSWLQTDPTVRSPLDLYRFASAGTLATATTANPYFSIDGGVTHLANFDTVSDWADWAAGTGPDSYDATSLTGTVGGLSSADIAAMAAIGFAVPSSAPASTSFSADSEAALNNAIAAIEFGATNTSYTINLTASLALNTALFPLLVPSGSTLTINGGGATIDGGGQLQGFAVNSGNVILQAMTIAHAAVVGGAGTHGGGGGGGGAAEGGGLMIASGATVTLNGVAFSGDSAVGGAGSAADNFNAGGNGGTLNNAGTPIQNGVTAASQTGGGAGGAGQGGGGGGSSFLSATSGRGGAGGWGGGGGGGGYAQAGTQAVGGTGGFGAGTGGNTAFIGANGYGGGGGGGGLGAGGDIFVASGGTLLLGADVLNGGTVAGGAGGAGYDLGFGAKYIGAPGGNGQGLGSGIFIQGDNTVTLTPTAGQTLTIADTIADQTGAGGTGTNAGLGRLMIANTGTVVLSGANTFAGGTTVQSGASLDLAGNNAAGTGAIAFAGAGTLRIEAGVTVGNTITAFGTTDSIVLAGVSNATAVSIGSGNLMTVSLSSGAPVTLQLDPAQSLAGNVAKMSVAGGNTTLTLAPAVSAAQAAAVYQTILQSAPSASDAATAAAQIGLGTMTLAQYEASLLASPAAMSSVLPALIIIDQFYGVTPGSAVLAAVAGTVQGWASIGMSVADQWSVLGMQFAHNGTFGALYDALDNYTFAGQIYQLVFGTTPSASIQTTLANNVTALAAAYKGYDPVHSDILGGKGALYAALLYYAENSKVGYFYTDANAFLTAQANTAFASGTVPTYAQSPELKTQFPSGMAVPPAAMSADPAVITMSGCMIDAGMGTQSIQFVSDTINDTLVLHAGANDTIAGFNLNAGDVLDFRTLIAEAGIIAPRDFSQFAAEATISTQDGDAVLTYPAGGQACTTVVLQGLGPSVTSLNDLQQHGAIRL